MIQFMPQMVGMLLHAQVATRAACLAACQAASPEALRPAAAAAAAAQGPQWRRWTESADAPDQAAMSEAAAGLALMSCRAWQQSLCLDAASQTHELRSSFKQPTCMVRPT